MPTDAVAIENVAAVRSKSVLLAILTAGRRHVTVGAQRFVGVLKGRVTVAHLVSCRFGLARMPLDPLRAIAASLFSNTASLAAT